MEAVYRQEMQRRAKALIEQITKERVISQRKLEQVLHLSSGALSKIRKGASPSPELVADLAFIARDPKNRIRELEEFWGTVAT